MSKRVGILTGGGDCPGLNAVIRAVMVKGIRNYNYKFIGIKNGWAGLLDFKWENLDRQSISGIIHRGGTILGTSRTNPVKNPEVKALAMENFKKLRLDALIAIGGEDTLGAAMELHQAGINIVAVPKTIDNDVSGTDYTFGFDTAVNVAMDAIDRVHTTAESHNRVMVVEVMGRHTGWIAIESGVAGGADIILIPEKPISIEKVCELLVRRHEQRGRTFSVVVVAEGANVVSEAEQNADKDSLIVQDEKIDAFGHIRLGGIGRVLAEEIEKRIGYETRYVILGHVQRGGSPTAFDRVLGTRFGIAAVDLVHKGDFGKMVCLRGNKIVPVALSEVTSKVKYIDDELYEMARVFFG